MQQSQRRKLSLNTLNNDDILLLVSQIRVPLCIITWKSSNHIDIPGSIQRRLNLIFSKMLFNHLKKIVKTVAVKTVLVGLLYIRGCKIVGKPVGRGVQFKLPLNTLILENLCKYFSRFERTDNSVQKHSLHFLP